MTIIENLREFRVYFLIKILLLVCTFPLKVSANSGKSHQWKGAWIFVICLFLILVVTTTAYFIRKFGCHITYTSEVAQQNNQTHTTVARELHVKVVEDIPTVSMAEIKLQGLRKVNGDDDQLECVVCLSEFKDEDLLHVLPNCLHVFHVNCISPWLATHVTCPICRASLQQHHNFYGVVDYEIRVDIEV